MTSKETAVKEPEDSKQVESLWHDARVKGILQVLYFIMVGLISAFFKKMHPGIGVSGSSAVYWLAPLILGRLLVKRDGGATFSGACVALWGIPLGLNNDISHNLALYAGAGLAIDVMAWLPFIKIRKVWGATLTGIVAHMVKFVIIMGSAFTSPVTKNFVASGIFQSAWQHVVFGAGAGFVAWAAFKVWQSAQNRLKQNHDNELPQGK